MQRTENVYKAQGLVIEKSPVETHIVEPLYPKGVT